MINVVAAIIKNDEDKILIAQRNLKKAQGGLWEFPGGKIEPNETKENAIVREIREELEMDIKVKKYVAEKLFNYPDREINLIAMECIKISDNMKVLEHEDVRWVSKEELKDFNFAPADMFIVEELTK